MKLAVAQWKLRPDSTLEAWADHVEEFASAAAGCDWLVLPELCSLDLAPAFPSHREEAAWLADRYPEIEEILRDAATRHSLNLVGGTHFRRTPDFIQNIAPVINAQGEMKYQPKIKMTKFEAEEWNITGGRGLEFFSDSRIGVTICYDCEFPEAGRILAE